MSELPTPPKFALCIDSATFAWWCPMGGNMLLDIGAGQIEKMQTRLIDRAICETDESTLQLLPYNVLLNEEGKVFCYVRGGGGKEGRLHGKLSIGIGGHVDEAPGGYTESLAYLLANEAAREIREEVALTGPIHPTFTHYLMDYTNAVGRVHLGLLSVNRIQTSQIGVLEDGMVENGEFVDVDFLCEPEQFSRLENWSQSVALHLLRQKQSAICN